MACIVKKHHIKVLFKEMQFVAFFIFHMGKTRMQVKNDLRCLRQKKSGLGLKMGKFCQNKYRVMTNILLAHLSRRLTR